MKRTGIEIIVLDSLRIGYKTGKNAYPILPAISASSSGGELIAVIGRNGIGKSTMLRTIAGLQPSLGGQVILDGKSASDYSRIELARSIGYISTEVVRVSNMRVADLERKERIFIHRILQFSLRTIKEVMVPLIRVTAIPDTLTVGQALEEFRTSRFSRLPVYHRRIDNLIGVLHDFDLLGEAGPDRPIRAFMRPVTYVPELKKIDRLLAEMQRP